jgi:nicotinamidase-related amidase
MAAALIVVDMLNPYEHDDADRLAKSVEQVLEPIGELIKRAEDEKAEIVYVNDNYGDWKSSHEQLVDHALRGERPDLVEPVLPPDSADFVVKARHSIFYGTPLEYLLRVDRGIERIVLCGQVTEQCILYSALDGYVRQFEVSVAGDGVAHIHQHLAEAALEMMERNMRADVGDAGELRLAE